MSELHVEDVTECTTVLCFTLMKNDNFSIYFKYCDYLDFWLICRLILQLID